MNEQLSKLQAGLSDAWSATLGRLLRYLEGLRPSDRLIAYALGLLTLILALSGIYALERLFLTEVPSYGGTLREGMLGSPRFVNPLLAISDTDRDLASLTYAGLMGHDNKGNLVPVLAESYEISEDGKIYTFRLRDGIRFSDGTPITAEDIVFTVRKAQDPGLKSPRLSDWAGIAVESLDAKTVQFTLPKAYSFFLEDTTLGILPTHIWREVSNEEFAFSPYMSEPVGAGAFLVSDIDRNNDGIVTEYVLHANEDYALGKPYLSQIRFAFFTQEADLARALRSGRVESAYGIPDPDALRAPYSRVFGVFFNHNQNPLFARLEVRKALSIALDRNELAREVLGGYATPVWGPLPPQSGVDAVVPVQVEADPIAEAARILEASDWVYDSESRLWVNEDEGLELSVTIKTSNVDELRAIAEEVKKDWNKLGVPVSIEFYEPSDLVASVIRPRKYEALLFGMVIGQDKDLFAFWHSSERNDPGLNIAMYTNSSVDGLLEKIRSESNPDDIATDLARVNELISEDYPAAFTHAPDFLYKIPPTLHGVRISQVASPLDRFHGVSDWYRHTEFVWPWFRGERESRAISD
jgi:peptide/nickel transport system substrate-binding protein